MKTIYFVDYLDSKDNYRPKRKFFEAREQASKWINDTFDEYAYKQDLIKETFGY